MYGKLDISKYEQNTLKVLDELGAKVGLGAANQKVHVTKVDLTNSKLDASLAKKLLSLQSLKSILLSNNVKDEEARAVLQKLARSGS